MTPYQTAAVAWAGALAIFATVTDELPPWLWVTDLMSIGDLKMAGECRGIVLKNTWSLVRGRLAPEIENITRQLMERLDEGDCLPVRVDRTAGKAKVEPILSTH